ncbi:MAG: hypothetical protein R3D98_15815 [Candidatus Krumholzibacteriia bacterium]
MDERRVDLRGEGRERIAHHIDHPHGLARHSLQVGQDGTGRIRLEVDPVAIASSDEDSASDERR